MLMLDIELSRQGRVGVRRKGAERGAMSPCSLAEAADSQLAIDLTASNPQDRSSKRLSAGHSEEQTTD